MNTLQKLRLTNNKINLRRKLGSLLDNEAIEVANTEGNRQAIGRIFQELAGLNK